MNFIMIGLLLREALDRLRVRLNMYLVIQYFAHAAMQSFRTIKDLQKYNEQYLLAAVLRHFCKTVSFALIAIDLSSVSVPAVGGQKHGWGD